VWLGALERSDRLQQQLAYWTDVLGGTLPVLELPADRPRPAVQSYRSGTVAFDLDPEVLRTVRAATSRAGATPFAFLLSSYVATLARWSGQDDIVVGTASASRSTPEIADVVGLFVNTVAIRTGVDTTAPFASLLDSVKRASVGAFAHQEVPFNRIVEALNPPRDL
jgi:Condensation domain